MVDAALKKRYFDEFANPFGSLMNLEKALYEKDWSDTLSNFTERIEVVLTLLAWSDSLADAGHQTPRFLSDKIIE